MNLDIVAVISRMFATVKDRIGPLLGLFVIFVGINIGLGALFFGLIGGSVFMMGDMANPGGGLGAMGIGFILAMILFYLAYFLVSLAQSLALTHHSSPSLTPAFGESFAMGFKRLPTLIGLLLLLGVAYFAFILVSMVVGFVLSMLGDAGAVIGLILFALAAIYLACRLSVVMAVIAVDGETNPIAAIRRSWALTGGNVLRIFLAILAFTVLVAIVIGLLVLAFGGTFYGLSGSSGGGAGAAIGAIGLAFVVFIGVIALFTIIAAAFVSSLHASLAGPQSYAETFD